MQTPPFAITLRLGAGGDARICPLLPYRCADYTGPGARPMPASPAHLRHAPKRRRQYGAQCAMLYNGLGGVFSPSNARDPGIIDEKTTTTFASQTIRRRNAHGKAQHQRQGARRAGRGRHAAAVGDPRAGRPHRHQVRLRRRAVRRLLGAHQRRGAALLLDPGRRRQGDRQDRHHRRPVARTARIRCRRPGPRSTCRNAATASPARSWRPRRCSRRSRSRPTPTSTRR